MRLLSHGSEIGYWMIGGHERILTAFGRSLGLIDGDGAEMDEGIGAIVWRVTLILHLLPKDGDIDIS